jgi:hypothetical protein
MSIYKNGKLIAGGRQCMPLLSFMWADHQLNDISWLRADTFSWQSGSVYQAVYQHLADDIDGKTLQSETIGSTTIQFYLADDGHKICPASEESNVVAIYTATGVAWYYIIDTVNQQFKLPRTKYGVTGLRDTVGNYVPETLPNVWYSNGGYTSDPTIDGALKQKVRYNIFQNETSSSTRFIAQCSFSATNCSDTYQNNAPVQERATQMYLYFYVGNFTQTALENTAGLNAELFNNKADLDMNNITATGKETIVGWGLPDYTAGVSVSSGYIATAKCWLRAHVSGDGGSGTAGEAYIQINGVTIDYARVSSWNYQTINDLVAPLDVGDVVTAYTNRGTATMTIFPMKGV